MAGCNDTVTVISERFKSDFERKVQVVIDGARAQGREYTIQFSTASTDATMYFSAMIITWASQA